MNESRPSSKRGRAEEASLAPQTAHDAWLEQTERYLREMYPTAASVQLVLTHRGMEIRAIYEKPLSVHAVWGLDGIEQFPNGGRHG